jgi:predicted transposase/invertase (TIGR01784 family)
MKNTAVLILGGPMAAQVIPLINDLVFQYVFGEEESLPILQSMLNAFFEYAGCPKVTSLKIQKSRITPDFYGDKTTYLDLVAQDETRRLINIEIQTYREGFYMERSMFYWSRLYSRQIKRGQKYQELRPVICINILDFNYFDEPSWYTVDSLKYTQCLQIHTIELPKVPAEPLNLAALWGKFIKEEGRSEAVDFLLESQETAIQEAIRRFKDFMSGIDGRFLTALAREKAERDRISFLAYAEEEGLRKGFDKGMQKGEKEAKLEIARRMKAQNFSMEQIIALTGLQMEDMASL